MSTTRVSLLQRIRSPEDHVAWREFVEIYTPLLETFGKRLNLPEADAADVAQMLFEKLLRRMRTFSYDHNRKFRGYLWRVFVNLSRKWYLGQRAVAPLELETVSEDVPLMEEREYGQFVMSRVLEIIQRRFQDSVWQSFWEHKVQSRPAREVAEELGLPESHVFSYSSRVLRTLRQELDGLLDE